MERKRKVDQLLNSPSWKHRKSVFKLTPFNPNGSEKRKRNKAIKKTAMIGYDKYLVPLAIETHLKTEESEKINEANEDKEQLNMVPSDF